MPDRPRVRGPGYWLRLPGPAAVAGAVAAGLLLVCGLGGGQPALAVAAVVPALAAWWVWHTRETWRDNADRWRHRHDDAF